MSFDAGTITQAANVPLMKKMLLCFNVKANDQIHISEITHHNNPRKVTYYKNFKMTDLHLAPAEAVKLNMIFELPQECQGELDLFLTTLFIKWRRHDSPIDNITLDEHTLVHPQEGKVEVTFHQKQNFLHRQKGQVIVKVRNLCNDQNNVHVLMDSNENLMRIGEKGKWKLLDSFGSHSFEFSVLPMKGGIF